MTTNMPRWLVSLLYMHGEPQPLHCLAWVPTIPTPWIPESQFSQHTCIPLHCNITKELRQGKGGDPFPK